MLRLITNTEGSFLLDISKTPVLSFSMRLISCNNHGAFLWGLSGSGSVIQDHWCIKGTDESSLVMDSSVPLMNPVSGLGSLIMIQITPKERTQSVIITDFRNSKQKDNSKTTEFNVQASS